jgi:hypothetical protein
MTPIRTRGLVIAGVLVTLAAFPALARGQDIAASFTMEGQGTSSTMKITTAGGNLRLDMTADQGQMSMIWAADSMLMIMHAQRMYMEFTKEMLERMQSMMGNMPGMPATPEAPDEDFGAYSFERTGATETINGMSAFEVKITAPDGDKGNLWLTTQTDTGLFEAFGAMSSAMANMRMPGMMQQGNDPAAELRQYMGMAQAMGLPDGRVIRVVDVANDVRITLTGVEQGPFGPETWAAPEGYTKQSMPMMR